MGSQSCHLRASSRRTLKPILSRQGKPPPDPARIPAFSPSPHTPPKRAGNCGRPAMCTHTLCHQLLRVFCESQRGASQLALPDSTAFSFLAQKFPTHAAACEWFYVHIYYICDIILRTSSGQAKKGLYRGIFFFLRKGKKSTTQALCVDSCVPGKGKKKECLWRG